MCVCIYNVCVCVCACASAFVGVRAFCFRIGPHFTLVKSFKSVEEIDLPVYKGI